MEVQILSSTPEGESDAWLSFSPVFLSLQSVAPAAFYQCRGWRQDEKESAGLGGDKKESWKGDF